MLLRRVTWAYAPSVNPTLACPNQALTSFTGTTACCSNEAAVWRTSWERMWGSPANADALWNQSMSVLGWM